MSISVQCQTGTTRLSEQLVTYNNYNCDLPARSGFHIMKSILESNWVRAIGDIELEEAIRRIRWRDWHQIIIKLPDAVSRERIGQLSEWWFRRIFTILVIVRKRFSFGSISFQWMFDTNFVPKLICDSRFVIEWFHRICLMPSCGEVTCYS